MALRCIQQDTLEHRGRKRDPLYQIRLRLRSLHDRRTKGQKDRLATVFAIDVAHIRVEVAYQCAQQVREVFHQYTLTQGRLPDARLINCLPTCPIHEIACMGRTLRRRKDAFLAHFDRVGASNGISKLGERIARGYRKPTSYNSKCSSSQEAEMPPPTPNSEEPDSHGVDKDVLVIGLSSLVILKKRHHLFSQRRSK